MCGIAGSVGHSETFCIEANAHQSKRGPDMSGILRITESIYFGHTLLSIIGHQAQPIESERYVMVYNGAWYNYKDFYPYETSDTSALLKHVETKGFKAALDDVNGMFAIAVYDRLQNKIYCAVDRFGQKPFYYHHENEKFAFASTPAALLSVKDKWAINEDALHSYWLLGSVMGEDSVWSGIKKLCASEMLEYDVLSDKVTISRYWEPEYHQVNNIEELVFDAIDKVKIADVPVNIFLSGGIDSSLVASRFANCEAIHLDSPEYVYAKQVADKFNIRLRCLSPESIEAETALMDYSYQCGEPSMAALIPYITAKEASKYSKVAITANGADELFFGYNRTNDKVDSKHVNHIFRDINRFALQNHIHKYLEKGREMELMTYVQFDLNKTLDFSSMCHSLEMRSPFLDHRLVECALSIPESVHRKEGNKTILKKMLMKMGFDSAFVNRPKLGFSIHYQPDGLPALKDLCTAWCISKGYLKISRDKFRQLSGRDQQYLEMSCLGFFFWYKTWKDKIDE